MKSLIVEALKLAGRDPDAGLEQITALVREDPSARSDLEAMLAASFEDAIAQVMHPTFAAPAVRRASRRRKKTED